MDLVPDPYPEIKKWQLSPGWASIIAIIFAIGLVVAGIMVPDMVDMDKALGFYLESGGVKTSSSSSIDQAFDLIIPIIAGLTAVNTFILVGKMPYSTEPKVMVQAEGKLMKQLSSAISQVSEARRPELKPLWETALELSSIAEHDAHRAHPEGGSTASKQRGLKKQVKPQVTARAKLEARLKAVQKIVAEEAEVTRLEAQVKEVESARTRQEKLATIPDYDLEIAQAEAASLEAGTEAYRRLVTPEAELEVVSEAPSANGKKTLGSLTSEVLKPSLDLLSKRAAEVAKRLESQK